MKESMDEDIDLIKKLHDGDNNVLEAIYRNNEAAFINWAGYHYAVDSNQAKDIFQLAVIALYRNVREQKLQQLTCTVKTYLFSIGKRLLLKLKKQEVRKEASSYENLEAFNVPDEIYANLIDSKKVDYILEQVGEPCKTILEKFYFHGKSMKEIAVETGYKSEGVIRKKKHHCMERLKKIIKTGNYTIGDFLE